ncbi:MAG: peptidoglycan-binding protein, partial [Hyphomicrobiaceae bacterium]
MSSVSGLGTGAGRRGRRLTAVAVLAGLSVMVAAGALIPPALAQAQAANWWEQIPGFGSPGASSQGRKDGEGRARDQAAAPLNDLRTDSTPLRSDAMLAAYDDAIARYQKVASSGGWGTIPGTRMIRPGDDDERVPYVRRRLVMGGDLRSQQSSQSFAFDGELEVAVRRFQERHGLRASGRVDQPTLQAMNIPAQARIAQLRLNQQRVRDLIGQRMEDKYVLVNVPAFQLEAVERQNVEQRHRVIAGKPERQTPSVRATIRALNFFPYWRVPDSVATLDLMPRRVKEPDYLAKEQIRVLTGSFNGPEIDVTNMDWRQGD